MPLEPVPDRQSRHHRSVDLRAYRRVDGLWDVEGHLVDRRAEDSILRSGRRLAAGEPLHDIWLRLTLDEEMEIRAISAAIDASPYAVCPGAIASLSVLVGIRIGSGWLSSARGRLPPASNCTHLVELLGPLATTAYQAIIPYKRARAATDDLPGVGPSLCHAHATPSPPADRFPWSGVRAWVRSGIPARPSGWAIWRRSSARV
ncbi:MAG: DUF2889 domain-containing protein [Rhodospirillum sp.]|nr:DUF2889 domain-containing protein [Rhodospirillum sp.]